MTEDLLDAPRGRLLCLELAKRIDPRVGEALQDLAYNAHVEAGSTVVRFGVDEDGRSFQSSGPVQARFTREQLAARIAVAVQDAAARGIHADDIGQALQRSVDLAAYWQPPRGEEIVAADPAIVRSLAPLAQMVAVHPSTQWWHRDRTVEQWAIEWDPSGDGAPFDPAPDAAVRWSARTREWEERAAREWPQYPDRGVSSEWWSHPGGAPHSTGGLPVGSSTGLPAGIPLVEDSLGWERAVAVPVRGGGGTYEVRTPEDWAHLCRRYPLEVTASHWYDWYQFTERSGRWLLPDWGSVARQWDAVHLTAAAYLTGATREIVVDDEYSTVIGGWGPDETYWLTGLVRDVEGPRVHWRAVPPDGDHEQGWERSD
ncbi:hypothetical protein [Microbacterium aurum]